VLGDLLGAEADQASHLRRTVLGVEVDVYAVLAGALLRHPLQADVRPSFTLSDDTDEEALVVLVDLGVERPSPELGQLARFDAVDGHATQLNCHGGHASGRHRQ
jgi:hypothetical protein